MFLDYAVDESVVELSIKPDLLVGRLAMNSSCHCRSTCCGGSRRMFELEASHGEFEDLQQPRYDRRNMAPRAVRAPNQRQTWRQLYQPWSMAPRTVPIPSQRQTCIEINDPDIPGDENWGCVDSPAARSLPPRRPSPTGQEYPLAPDSRPF